MSGSCAGQAREVCTYAGSVLLVPVARLSLLCINDTDNGEIFLLSRSTRLGHSLMYVKARVSETDITMHRQASSRPPHPPALNALLDSIITLS